MEPGYLIGVEGASRRRVVLQAQQTRPVADLGYRARNLEQDQCASVHASESWIGYQPRSIVIAHCNYAGLAIARHGQQPELEVFDHVLEL